MKTATCGSQITHTRFVEVRQDVALGVLEQPLVELVLPAPLALLVEFAAEQAEKRGFHFRFTKLVCRDERL